MRLVYWLVNHWWWLVKNERSLVIYNRRSV
jgi:hypothetical protein